MFLGGRRDTHRQFCRSPDGYHIETNSHVRAHSYLHVCLWTVAWSQSTWRRWRWTLGGISCCEVTTYLKYTVLEAFAFVFDSFWSFDYRAEWGQNTTEFACHLCKQNGKYKAYVTLRTDRKKDLLGIINTKRMDLIFSNDAVLKSIK